MADGKNVFAKLKKLSKRKLKSHILFSHLFVALFKS